MPCNFCKKEILFKQNLFFASRFAPILKQPNYKNETPDSVQILNTKKGAFENQKLLLI